MKTAKLIAWLGLFAMTAVLINGFVNGSFYNDGAKLFANPWGIISLVDLFAGFALFALWIAFREEHLPAKLVWIILLIGLGFFTGSLYVLINLYRSKGDWLTFFLGARKESLLKQAGL